MGDAWFFKMTPSEPSQMDDYMDEAAYKKYVS
jgi:glycine cleavage system H protein